MTVAIVTGGSRGIGVATCVALAHAGGSIVSVSSTGARIGSPNTYVDYAASKAAVETMPIPWDASVSLKRLLSRSHGSAPRRLPT